MAGDKIYPIPQTVADRAYINEDRYNTLYQQSIDDPDTFWADMADQFLDFSRPWDKVSDWHYDDGQGNPDVSIQWFTGAKLNVTYNCIDRHLEKRADQTAIIWESDDPNKSDIITYQQLSDHVNRFANVLKARGVKKGDRVCIYMPMIPEAAYSMLACARIGAVHSVVFGGFSPEAIKDRILDSDCQIVITADEGLRGGKAVPLKKNTDKAVAQCPNVHTVLVIQNTKGEVAWNDKHDIWYHEVAKTVEDYCPPEEMDAEDPLFILYTSGSTGKPKGVLHTTAGYLLYAAVTHKYTFDYKDGDVYWCTADVGWITGHSYIVYGPLANGAITLMFEGIPTYPDASRFWQVVEKHKVNTFYTAPTAIRALMSEGDEPVKKTDRSSLHLLGSVGEPINPEAWEWYYHVVGETNCPIVDT
ncbi:MAG: acetate--CoA ligase, partial [Gammaproteobacteria bacterium]|nr:acetate--CoA ligase [Gammaproteobacteria bacterium]